MKDAGAQSTGLREQAADWVVHLHDLDPGTTEAERRAREGRHGQFIHWLQQSEAHVEAFLHADNRFCELSGIDPHHRLDLSQLMKDRATAVVRLLPQVSATPSGTVSRPVFRRIRPARQLGYVAVLALVAISGVIVAQYLRHSDAYITGIGEQRTVKLGDGSTMQLNTLSRAEVHFSASTRQIKLLKGEALFVVERDTHRPFLVTTPTATVRAVGTQFDVYQRPNASMTVSVIEGAVQLTGPAPLQLAAGEAAQVTLGRAVKQDKPNVGETILWRERVLKFRGQTLTEIATEFNRYNARQIVIPQPQVGERRLSGTFNADQPQILVKYLSTDESLSVGSDGSDWVVRSR